MLPLIKSPYKKSQKAVYYHPIRYRSMDNSVINHQIELDDDTKELVSAYIEAQDEPELTDKIHHKKKIAKALEKLEINGVIVPCRILNDRQCGRFPCPPLCTRVQGL